MYPTRQGHQTMDVPYQNHDMHFLHQKVYFGVFQWAQLYIWLQFTNIREKTLLIMSQHSIHIFENIV